MITARLDALKLSWNSQAILSPAERFVKRLLDRFGAYCMRVQRNSIKQASKKRQVSEAGQPPVFHVGRGLFAKGIKGTIFYATDYRKKECSIGAEFMPGTAGSAGGSRVPGTIEHGGVAIIMNRRGGKRRAVNVRARPSAGPAFAKTIDKKLPELIEGGIMREV